MNLQPSESEQGKVWALIDFTSWCTASNGNQATTISSKVAAIQCFYRVHVGVELPNRSPLIKKSTFQSMSRYHTLAGTRPLVRLPIPWDMLIADRTFYPLGVVGVEYFMVVSLGMRYFFFGWSDEIFANGSGVVHLAHRLTRGDVAYSPVGVHFRRLQ